MLTIKGGSAGALLFVGLIAILVSPPAAAQVQRGGGASAALMQQYQQVSAERTQLQADNEKLKKDLDASKKQLDALKQQLAVAKAGAGRSEAALAAEKASEDSDSKALADTRAKMQELIGRFRDTIATLRTTETERGELQQRLTEKSAAVDKCAERNEQLYQVTDEILKRYQSEGMFGHLARAEPFTRLKRTQVDNLVLEDRERAAELRTKAPGASAATDRPAPPPAPAPEKPAAPPAEQAAAQPHTP